MKRDEDSGHFARDIFWIPCEISKTQSFKMFQPKPSAVLAFQEQKTVAMEDRL